jgi:hypothetical protein
MACSVVYARSSSEMAGNSKAGVVSVISMAAKYSSGYHHYIDNYLNNEGIVFLVPCPNFLIFQAPRRMYCLASPDCPCGADLSN